MAGRPTASATDRRHALREAQKRFTRQHILEAATTVFMDLGYIPSTVEDIIERAGTSRRTFYAHFRSKTQVLVELSTALVPEIEENYRRLDAALEDGSREALREWMANMLDWGSRYGGLVPVWQQAETIEPELEARRKEIVHAFPDYMPAYFSRFQRKQWEEARLRLVLLSVQLDRYFAYAPPRDMDEAQRSLVADVLAGIWHGALHADPFTAPKATRRTGASAPSGTSRGRTSRGSRSATDRGAGGNAD